jgi:hypothetical protein
MGAIDPRTESAEDSVRQPPLRLVRVPGPEAERLAVLLAEWDGKLAAGARVNSSAYLVAAFAWHYGKQLDLTEQRGLLAFSSSFGRESAGGAQTITGAT